MFILKAQQKQEVENVQEIMVKDNKTGLRVFINGVPNLRNIPKAEMEVFVSALEKQISSHYEKSPEK